MRTPLIDGQRVVPAVLGGTVDISQFPQLLIQRVDIVTGGASALPEFPLYLANKFAIEVEIGNAWRNVSFAPERQNELLAVSNHFGVAAGLAERVEYYDSVQPIARH